MADMPLDPTLVEALKQAMAEVFGSRTTERERALAEIAHKKRLTIEETALLLNVSKRTVYSRIEDKLLRSHKDGDSRYVLRVDAERYIDQLDRQQNGKRPA